MKMQKSNYPKLAVMTLLSFISMYILMYSMVNTFPDVYNSFNQFYMAAVMTAPMVLIEIILMKDMYSNKKLNIIIASVSIVCLIVFFTFIRKQTVVSDTQFIRSMIPHHSGAILMCREGNLQDAELQELCKKISQSQQEEIDQMRNILTRLEK